MRQGWIWASLLLCAAVLSACSSGPVRRVSAPAASIQQLTVHADGNWSVDLRLQNYSSIPMRFTSVGLAITVSDQAAGTLDGPTGLHLQRHIFVADKGDYYDNADGLPQDPRAS